MREEVEDLLVCQLRCGFHLEQFFWVFFCWGRQPKYLVVRVSLEDKFRILIALVLRVRHRVVFLVSNLAPLMVQDGFAS